MPPKNFEQIIGFDESSGDYEDFCQLIKNFAIDPAVDDVESMKNLFQKTRDVLLKLNDDFRDSIELFEKESRDQMKKSICF
jgi:hypothetical protein